MTENFITRQEHVEYAKRMEDEHKRLNRRLEAAEEAISQNTQLTISVEKMAVSMEQMCKEQQDQGKRLTELESRDGKKWQAVTSHIATAAVGAVITYFLVKLGIK